MIILPGLIDPHVHMRTPGQSYKENFSTGTKAALAGGFTTVIDMPNNSTPITTEKLLDEKIKIAKKQTVCDIGFHFGSLGDNLDEFKKVSSKAKALKIYLNITTGGFIVDEKVFESICKKWPKGKVIIVHAEENILDVILKIGNKYKQKIHVAHVSSQKELSIIKRAKKKRWMVTCGVTPHHLFLEKSDEKKLGAFAKMKPALKTRKDQEFIWKNLMYVDIVESDHAPHTLKEKKSHPQPFGIPGLETTLHLLLTAMSKKRLALKDIKRLCHDGPAKIFNIKTDKKTYIEIDESEEWILKNKNLKTKCKWSPFDGWKMKGRVKRVFIRGTKVFENDKILVRPGFGKII